MTNSSVLKLEGISASYGNESIIHDATLSVLSGQFVGLLGGNGSGKTTLLRIISGELKQTVGNVFIKDKKARNGVINRMKSGIVYIHQFPTVFSDLEAWENFAIWSAPLGSDAVCGLEKRNIILFLKSKLDELGLKLPLEKKTSDLTEVELQILEFCRCFLIKPTLILIDEATSILDTRTSEKILAYLKEFCRTGGAVITISHRHSELKKYADVIYELREKSLFPFQAEEMPAYKQNTSNEYHGVSSQSNNPLLDITFTLRDGRHSVKLEMKEGEIMGITGADGTDYEHLPGQLLELLPNTNGRDGKRRMLGTHFSYLGKDRDTDWLFPEQTVVFNIAVANKGRIFISNNENAQADLYIKKFNIVPAKREKIVDGLSGGNKLKTALARTLHAGTPMNILDEPFTGTDRASRTLIMRVIQEERAMRGTSFLLFSKEFHDLVSCCDTIMAFKRDGDHVLYDREALAGMASADLEATFLQ